MKIRTIEYIHPSGIAEHEENLVERLYYIEYKRKYFTDSDGFVTDYKAKLKNIYYEDEDENRIDIKDSEVYRCCEKEMREHVEIISYFPTLVNI